MEKQYLTVAGLNRYIKQKIDHDSQLQNIYIKGEISNVKHHSSGHLYFTLKDDNSRISAVMFASNAKSLAFQAKEGLNVLIHANVSVYDVAGSYQLYVHTMELDGIGNLFLQFEQLKARLYKEGLFDNKHKKPIPTFPRTIAVLTAYPSAALMDIMKVIKQRYPVVRVIIFPVPVQGKGAYIKISEKLKEVDKVGFSTILLARGGGPYEDLWNFNEELLARTIFECKTPIISAVGHEIDTTISDYVADVRGLTPTDGAAIACPNMIELMQKNKMYESYFHDFMNNTIRLQRQKVDSYSNFYLFKDPRKLFMNHQMKIGFLEDNLEKAYLNKLSFTKNRFDKCIVNFTHLQKLFFIRTQEQLKQQKKALDSAFEKSLQINQNKWNQLVIQLDALSPLKVMQRGYSITYHDNKVITSASSLKENDELVVQYHDGIIKTKVQGE